MVFKTCIFIYMYISYFPSALSDLFSVLLDKLWLFYSELSPWFQILIMDQMLILLHHAFSNCVYFIDSVWKPFNIRLGYELYDTIMTCITHSC